MYVHVFYINPIPFAEWLSTVDRGQSKATGTDRKGACTLVCDVRSIA